MIRRVIDRALIPEAVIAEIVERTDIIELVGRSVDLRKAGTSFKGLCPFHDERTPSFSVSPLRRRFYCFGCGAKGDAIGFVIQHEGKTFREAIEELAAASGVQVPEQRPLNAHEKAERERKRTLEERLLEVQDSAASFYSSELFGQQGGRARRYLEDRRVSRRAAEAFRLGWASGDKRAFGRWAQERSVSLEELAVLGLVVPPKSGWRADSPLGDGYLRFRNRVLFPVVDIRGEIVGFGGRILEGSNGKVAKYINSPETPVYTKGDHLYGAYTAKKAARRHGRVVVCEGNVDVIAMWDAGFEGTVAAMGTALTPRQARLLKRMGDEVICLMDGDAAGRKAAFSSLVPFLEQSVQPRAVLLPDGEDPDSFLKKQGRDSMSALLDNATALLDLLIDHAHQAQPDDPPGRARALREIAPALAHVTDPLERELYWQKVSETLRVPSALIDTAVSGSNAHGPARPRSERADRAGSVQTSAGEGFTIDFGPHDSRPIQSETFLGPEATSGNETYDGALFLTEDPGFEVGPCDLVIEPGVEESTEAMGSRQTRAATVLHGEGSGTFSAELAKVSRREWEVVDLILQYPYMAVRFQQAGGLESLTHTGLAGFFSALCEEIGAGRTPNLDRLLINLDDRELSAFLMERHVAPPTQTDESVGDALEQACLHLKKDSLKRRRAGIHARMLEVSHDEHLFARCNEELKQVQRELIELNSKGAH